MLLVICIDHMPCAVVDCGNTPYSSTTKSFHMYVYLKNNGSVSVNECNEWYNKDYGSVLVIHKP